MSRAVTDEAEALRARMIETCSTWRDAHPGDQHVMPLFGAVHDSDARCWCLPTCIERVGMWPNDRRVWLHAVDN